MYRAFRKHVLLNRNLGAWIAGGTILGCGGGSAGGVLDGVALLLQVIASAL